MTPMQKLKNNFILLKTKLNNFEEVNLNKSKPKDISIQNVDDEYALCFPNEDTNFSHFIKAGVKSDFIKIYKIKTKKEKYSVAFHFKYLDINEPKIQCSVKEGEIFNISDEMSIIEFKEKINHLNDVLVASDFLENVVKVKEVFSIAQPRKKLKM